MKKQTFLILTLALITVISCKKDPKVGGSCTYVDLDIPVKVTFMDGSVDTAFMISMQPNVEDPGDEVYRLSRKQLNNMETNFDFKEFENKENVFILTQKKITEGACTPFILSKMLLKK